MNIDSEDILELVKLENYRDFLTFWLKIQTKRLNRKYTFSDLSRAANFSSRSFIHDICKNRKTFSVESIYKIANALNTTTEIKSYFIRLVEAEYQHCRLNNENDLRVYKALNNQRSRLLSKSKLKLPNKDLAYIDFNLPIVFASLGGISDGVTINDVVKKSTLEKRKVVEALTTLIQNGNVKQKNRRYFAINNHLDFTGIDKSKYFKSFFQHQLEKAYHLTKSEFNSTDKLFFHTTFSINQANMPQLKEELKDLLLKYVDSKEKVDGNKVVNINCSLF